MPELKFKNLCFRWLEKENNLFGPLEMVFNGGKITGLLGVNGIGKSTLLNVIACRLKAQEGEILINNRTANASDFNYMLQQPDRLLFQHLTLEQNIRLAMLKSNVRDYDDDQLAVFFPDGLPLSHNPWQCSVGQRQRAVIFRTILEIDTFPVTLMDEPFANVSRESKKIIYSLLRKTIADSSSVLIFVTHDLSEACILAERVAVLNDGLCKFFDVSKIKDEKSFLQAQSLRKNIQTALLTNNDKIGLD